MRTQIAAIFLHYAKSPTVHVHVIISLLYMNNFVTCYSVHVYVLVLFFASILIQRWVGDLTECLVLHKELVDSMNLQPLLDKLTLELLVLSELSSLLVLIVFETCFAHVAFSREHTIRLENACVLKSILQASVISDKALNK